VVSARLGRLSIAERAAERALALPEEDDDALTPELRLETALLGARAARAQEHREAAVGLFGAVLAIDAEHAEALFGIGELRLALGDAAGARDALLRLLEPARTRIALFSRPCPPTPRSGSAKPARRCATARLLTTERFAHAGPRACWCAAANEEAIVARPPGRGSADGSASGAAAAGGRAELTRSGAPAAERLLRDGAWPVRPGRGNAQRAAEPEGHGGRDRAGAGRAENDERLEHPRGARRGAAPTRALREARSTIASPNRQPRASAAAFPRRAHARPRRVAR
jgi:hypothetical protein